MIDLTSSTTKHTVPTEEDDIETVVKQTKQLEGKHILLFVSNQTNASILRMHLTRGGAQVTLLISSLVGNCQPRDALTEVGRWRAQPAGRSSWSALTSES